MSGDWVGRADDLARDALAQGDPTGWFDRLYAAADAGEVSMPWDRGQAHPLLIDWAGGTRHDGGRAVVVGCGLGEEAEFVAGLGYDTVAFDIAETAVRLARERHPGSPVEFRVADLLDLPDEWRHAFDLVVEIYTVQALPRTLRSRATAAVTSLVGLGGRLLVVSAVLADDADPDDGPPWPLTRHEAQAFEREGLSFVRLERLPGSIEFWRAELRGA